MMSVRYFITQVYIVRVITHEQSHTIAAPTGRGQSELSKSRFCATPPKIIGVVFHVVLLVAYDNILYKGSPYFKYSAHFSAPLQCPTLLFCAGRLDDAGHQILKYQSTIVMCRMGAHSGMLRRTFAPARGDEVGRAVRSLS